MNSSAPYEYKYTSHLQCEFLSGRAAPRAAHHHLSVCGCAPDETVSAADAQLALAVLCRNIE
eukprot:2219660-Prymnesium_polylepis.1